MATKTINLTGAEVAVTGLDGAHAHIRNDSAEVIYAAKTAGITAGADGVASIPAGQSDTLRGISGVIYLLGTGSVLIQSDDYVVSPFKTSAASGGSGADEVARAAITTHSGNAEIHVTAAEKASWNAINYSNPNLLINPDFRINQRGLSEYTDAQNGEHIVDRWKVNVGAQSVLFHSSGISINVNKQYAGIQQQSNPRYFRAGEVYTASAFFIEQPHMDWYLDLQLVNASDGSIAAQSVNIETANMNAGLNILPPLTVPMDGEYYFILFICIRAAVESTIDIGWAKLEIGGIATPFCPPNHAEELLKIQAMDGTIPADTLDGLHANEIASNPNLLVNPDFAINQRGKDSYTGTSAYTYTVDRWFIWKYNCDAYGTVTVNDDGTLSVDGVNGANDAILTQELENGARLVGKIVTLSMEIEEIEGLILVQQHYNTSSALDISAPGIHKVTFEWQEATKYRIALNNTNCNHYKIKWIKLEIGSIATPFTPPDPATELAKCQRYYQIRSTGDISEVDLRPGMRTTPTVTQLSDGNYAYSAEL